MKLIVVGLNHKTAHVATREAFAVPSEMVPGMNRRIVNEPTVAEAMVLSTCNRVEIYAVPEGDDSDARETLIRALATERGLDPDELLRHGYVHSGRDAARHLVRVCASLDSLVVGEAQILAQVKEAFAAARDAGSIGPTLEQAVQGAFRGGKAVRTDTGIAEETVSIGSVAVELARRIFPTLARCRVLVIGAGKMGRVTARALARAGVAEVIVTNRSPARAEKLAAELGWTARPFGELDDLLVAADVVLTCTGAERPILDPKRLKPVVKRRKYRPLFLVDIAVPRDVDPTVSDLDQVYLYNIDDLEAVSREHLAHRQEEAQKAELIVEDAVARIVERASIQAVVPLIKAVRERTEAVVQSELERAFSKRLAHLQAADREAIIAASHAAINKLLHPVLTTLREQGHERFDVATAARLLFGLDPATSDGSFRATSDGSIPDASPLDLSPEELS